MGDGGPDKKLDTSVSGLESGMHGGTSGGSTMIESFAGVRPLQRLLG